MPTDVIMPTGVIKRVNTLVPCQPNLLEFHTHHDCKIGDSDLNFPTHSDEEDTEILGVVGGSVNIPGMTPPHTQNCNPIKFKPQII